MSTCADILYTNIGRGHPSYVDGIESALPRERIASSSDVFAHSEGISGLLWRLAAQMYRRDSSSGGGRAYSAIRKLGRAGKESVPQVLMGSALRRRFLPAERPLVVAHPLLVSMLKEHPALIYQHGEAVVPEDAVVTGARLTLLPTEEAARPFREAGVPDERIRITGLCIERPLVTLAERYRQARLARLTGDTPLTLVAFSSGAEPRAHVEQLVCAASGHHADLAHRPVVKLE